MNPARSILLAASRNAWLRDHAAKHDFVRRTVSRFMPGEQLSDALAAAHTLQAKNIAAIFTHLGENIRDAAEAAAVTNHYLGVLRSVQEQQLQAEISVKPTQLGLDLNFELCYQNLREIIAAEIPGRMVWIDMEASNYVDVTLQLYRRALSEFPNVGLCLQAYLRRTENDLTELLPLRASIRLVKGAYSEPPEVAFPQKSDVDANYLALAKQMLAAKTRQPTMRPSFGTHDIALLQRIAELAAAGGMSKADVEVQMLYGIKSAEQQRLAREGYTSKVLVAYGTHWYAWFMRRLAERPANLWFVARNIFGSN